MTSKGEMMLPIDFPAGLYSRLAQPDNNLKTAIARPILLYALGGVDAHPTMREFVALFFALSDHETPSTRKRAESTVLLMARKLFGADFLHFLPLFVGVPLREAARTCQLGPPAEWRRTHTSLWGETI
jgi:anaphase-promoting complex subunit 1